MRADSKVRKCTRVGKCTHKQTLDTQTSNVSSYTGSTHLPCVRKGKEHFRVCSNQGSSLVINVTLARGSGQKNFKTSRVGSGRVGSGRIGSGRIERFSNSHGSSRVTLLPDSTRPEPPGSTRPVNIHGNTIHSGPSGKNKKNCKLQFPASNLQS